MISCPSLSTTPHGFSIVSQIRRISRVSAQYAGKPDEDIRAPEFYIVPRGEIEHIIGTAKKVPKFFVRPNDKSLVKFRDAWHLVADYLDIDAKTVVRGDRSIA
jgi:hypothetical protein